MPIWLQIIVVASTLAGLGIAGLAVWAGLRGWVGTQTAETDEEVAELREALETQALALATTERRLQNLEAIVTSESWDELQGEAPRPLIDLEGAPPAGEEAGRAEEIANRLKA